MQFYRYLRLIPNSLFGHFKQLSQLIQIIFSNSPTLNSFNQIQYQQANINRSTMSGKYVEKLSFNSQIEKIQIDQYMGTVIINSNDTPNNIKVETEFPDVSAKDDYKVTFANKTLTLESKNKNCSVSTINGTTYISGGGISIINGVIYGAEKAKEAPTAKIYVPSSLNLSINGSCKKIQSHVAFKTVDLHVSGQSSITLKEIIHRLKGKMSGQTSLSCPRISGADVNMRLSGQSSCYLGETQGDFSSVTVDTSGQSSFRTYGTCEQDYEADSSGQSSISHSGTVSGKVRKNSSGQSSVKVY